MPLKRTPPSTPLQVEESEANQSSAPVTDTEIEGSSNMTSRPRARKRQHGDEMNVFMAELRSSMESLRKQQDTMQETIKNIQKQNSEIINSMEFISKQYEDMKDRLIKLDSERNIHLAYIQTLETKVETLERIQKQATVEIRNVPVQRGETRDDLLNIVKRVGETISVSVGESQIRDVFRLNTKKGEKAIIVDFSSVIIKDKVIESVKNYNRKNRNNMLNSRHLGIEGQTKLVFIAESLTKSARKIFFLAREFGKKNGYAYCWTAHGRIFLRKREGAIASLIYGESDLEKLQSCPDM